MGYQSGSHPAWVELMERVLMGLHVAEPFQPFDAFEKGKHRFRANPTFDKRQFRDVVTAWYEVLLITRLGIVFCETHAFYVYRLHQW